MPRIFVQNLPKNLNENELRKRFEIKGEITDIRLNRGKRHAVIGYKDKADANEAVVYFNNTFIFTNKINVRFSDIEDKSGHTLKNRPKVDNNVEEVETKEKIKKKRKKLKEEFEELIDDPEFSEFIQLQRNIGSGNGRHIWGNDMEIKETMVIESKDTEVTEDKEVGDKSVDKKSTKKVKKSERKAEPKEKHEFVVKMKGLPYKVKRRQIKDFFEPLKPLSLRLPPKVKGIAYLSFSSMQELTQALVKHRSFMDGHRIEIMRCNDKKQLKEQTIEAKGEVEAKPPKWLNAVPAEEPIGESGRIYVRNLSYTCNEIELRALFETYGPLSELHLPIDSFTKKQKGFAFVSFVFPEHAVKASSELDKTDFNGRLLHLIAAKPKPDDWVPPFAVDDKSSYKKTKQIEKKNEAQSQHQWNSLFIGANAIADIMAKKFNIKKSELLADSNTNDSIAVRMALGETQIVNEMRRFLLENGVHLRAFGEPNVERSKNVILVKNLPMNTTPGEVRELFEKHGLVLRVILPPNGMTAIVEMQESNEANNAFKRLAYNNFKHYPLYLEWAPNNVFREKKLDLKNMNEEIEELVALEKTVVDNRVNRDTNDRIGTNITNSETENEFDFDIAPEEDTTLFVKNLNFDTIEEDFRNHFQRCGQIYSADIAYKKNGNNRLSMGYGFIQFVYKKSAQKALKEMQNSVLDGHTLELKISHRTTEKKQKTISGRIADEKQTGTKICVKNIPFEATVRDVQKLFSVFGELKAVRLPKKLSQVGAYRGFGFVDFVTKNDAKRAFDALCHSTHLYGRPLALEWAKDASDETQVQHIAAKTAKNFQKGPPLKRLKKSDIVNDLESKTSVPYSDD